MQQGSSFPTIETRRLRLREITDADAPALFEIHGNRELMKWFGNDPVADLAAAADLVKLFASWRTLPNPGTRWGIELRSGGQLLGTCGLFGWNRAWRKCTVGYELDDSVHGHGFMREALVAALSWGFENMELNRIEALIHPDNVRSVKLASKLGFVAEGRLRQGGHWCGRYHDLDQYSLLRSEWRLGHGELNPSIGRPPAAAELRR